MNTELRRIQFQPTNQEALRALTEAYQTQYRPVCEIASRLTPDAAPLVEGLLEAHLALLTSHQEKTPIVVDMKDAGFGPHCPASAADYLTQETGMRKMLKLLPNAKFIVEEAIQDPLLKRVVLTPENYKSYLAKPDPTICYDPLDGSTLYLIGKPGWGMTAGRVESGIPTAGAILNPREEIIVFGTNEAAYSLQLNSLFNGDQSLEPKDLKSDREKPPVGVFLYGVDIPNRPPYLNPLSVMAEQFTTSYTAGSCAIGLQDLLTGKAKAMFQPVQHPWDWCGGYPLIKAIGGSTTFITIKDESVVTYDSPQLEFFHPNERNAGFVVSPDPALTDKLVDLFIQTYSPEPKSQPLITI